MKLRKKIWGPIALASALILGACSGDEQNIKQVTADSDETSQTITIENDGVSITYDEAPKKAISINQHVTEVMLALGLEDSMVGTAYLDDQIYAPLQEAYDQVPVLAVQYPSKEQVISTEADFIYGGWASAFNEKNLMTREELEQLGIGSYLQSSSVKVAPELEDIYTDIRNIAKIFRVEERGETLIEEMNADIEKIKEKVPAVDKPIDVLVFDSGDKDVFTATQNFMNTLVNMAGANNIFGDIEKNWATVSKEDAVERNPEAIIVIDYGSTSAQEKINFLKNDPALSQTPAVQNERFVILPLSAASEGVRVAEALEIIVKGLYPDSF
ncbi:MAG: ABC transporter substrate-binding protein [Solibacillus sp.]|uniref:ABC transporter substrate-binding protein n=1 Tax=Solibacillus sp. TaxID=1909654 RepID=UPI0033153167